jgi:hypothetical protein
MARANKIPDLHPRDRWIVEDIVRFGVLATKHLAWRYGVRLDRTPPRLAQLCRDGFVKLNRRWLHPVDIYFPTPLAIEALEFERRPDPPYPQLVSHHLAVADLHDLLLEDDPMAGWRTELELRIDRQREAPYDWGRRNAHVPDGMLLKGDERIAIEVEINRKSSSKYAKICEWYAAQADVDRLRWYAPEQAVRGRLENVVRRHGFRLDLDIAVLPFPNGVQVRKWD